MTHDLAELGGIFLLVIGAGLCVGAAALVSTALAVLVAGIACLFGGVVVVYVANAAARAPSPKPGDRS